MNKEPSESAKIPEQSKQTTDMKAMRQRMESVLGIPFTTGNTIEPLRNGKEIFPAMLEAVEQAQEVIEFVTFVYWTGDIAQRFATTLAEKARSGVKVRVLLDSFGAKEMKTQLLDDMESAGVDICWFRPLSSLRLWQMDSRTHRKILVVDGYLGFTGGVGIAEEWEGDATAPDEWRETHFRITGPAVQGLRGAFIANWAETGRLAIAAETMQSDIDTSGNALIQVMRTTASASWSDIATLFYLLTHLAQKSLKICTAYFVPDDDMVNILSEAVKRGVSVEILIPGPYHDERLSLVAGQNRFTELMQAGVKISSYQPTMLHLKVLLVDDILACIGSANFNQRSMGKDEEIALCVLDTELARQLSDDFDNDLQRAEPYDLAAWQQRSLTQKTKELLSRLIKHQL